MMADCSEAINSLIAVVEAIEYELGVTPSSVYQNVRARLDILESRINNPYTPSPTVTNPFLIGNTGNSITVGSGVPSSLEQPGSVYLRTDGYYSQTLYTRGTDSNWHLISPNLYSSQTINFGTINASSSVTQVITIIGATVGQNVIVNPRAVLVNNIVIDYCRVSNTNTIEIRLYNRSGSGITVNQVFDIMVFPNS